MFPATSFFQAEAFPDMCRFQLHADHHFLNSVFQQPFSAVFQQSFLSSLSQQCFSAFFGSQAGLSSRLLPVLLCEEYVVTSLTANFRLICGPAGIRAGEQSVCELNKSITIPTGPQRRLQQCFSAVFFSSFSQQPFSAAFLSSLSSQQLFSAAFFFSAAFLSSAQVWARHQPW